MELGGRESFVRGRGYLKDLEGLSDIAIRAAPQGASVRVSDVGSVRFGPQARRGAPDFDGLGEAVGAIVVMRYGENARGLIERVEAKLDDLRKSLPPGVEIVTTYDRSALIERSIDTLKHALAEEMTVVALVILIFLFHFRSALLPIMSLPLAVLLSFVPMYLLGVPSTIMSLGGIAIAIGATVDAEIVMVEACHKKLEHAPKDNYADRTGASFERSGEGGHACDLLLAAHHRGVVHPGVRAQRRSRAALPTARVREDISHARRGDPQRHPRAGAS
jgi:Cu(I)/Ag(I) efflux system membrane protein CusA/SilA